MVTCFTKFLLMKTKLINILPYNFHKFFWFSHEIRYSYHNDTEHECIYKMRVILYKVLVILYMHTEVYILILLLIFSSNSYVI